MRIVRRLCFVAFLLAACLPLGGCLGFLLGYALGEWGADSRAELDQSALEDIERHTQWAVSAPNPSARAAALDWLEERWAVRGASYQAGRMCVPLGPQVPIEERVPRIAECLEDPDAKVRERAVAFLRAFSGDDVPFSLTDVVVLEKKAPGANGPAPSSEDVSEAEGRAGSAALRVYALARLGTDQRAALPLLRRGLEYHGPYDTGVIAFRCALAIHAVTREHQGLLSFLTDALQRGDEQSKIAAALTLGRIGPPAREALDALVRAEGSGTHPLRRATAAARARIVHAGV